MFTIQRCSPTRGEICSCTHVLEMQCTHIKQMLPLLRDSSGGRAIFHDMFFFLYLMIHFLFCVYMCTVQCHVFLID